MHPLVSFIAFASGASRSRRGTGRLAIFALRVREEKHTFVKGGLSVHRERERCYAFVKKRGSSRRPQAIGLRVHVGESRSRSERE